MAINSYDDAKIMKGGIWVTITKASCIISFKPRHVRARLNTIFVAVAITWFTHWMYIPEYPPESSSFSFKKRPTTTSSEYNTWSFPGLGYEINSLDTSNSSEHHIKLIQ